MATLLHVSSSPRGAASETLGLANAFLEQFRRSHPDVTIETWDLWDGTLPEFGPPAARAKMAVFEGRESTGVERRAWESAVAAFDRFSAADSYVFSVPMWNSSVPYILKQFIDVVSQPGHAFAFDSDRGYSGLVRNKSAAVFYSSAVWGPGRPSSFGVDFLQPYFEHWLKWIGIENIRSIRFQPNLVAGDADERRIIANAKARALAVDFLTPCLAGIER